MLLFAVAKIICSMLVMIRTKDLCFGPKLSWMVCMMVYDLCYTGLVIITLKHLGAMNHVIRRHTSTFNFNNENQNEQKENLSPSDSSDHENDEVREYDVEQSHRYHRVASLSSNIARSRRKIDKATKFLDK